jgi:hypothetical protein
MKPLPGWKPSRVQFQVRSSFAKRGQLIKRKQGVVTGAPSGFVISLLVQAAAFLLAGMLEVFNLVKKEE